MGWPKVKDMERKTDIISGKREEPIPGAPQVVLGPLGT